MSANSVSVVSEQLSTQYGAVKMLHSRVRLVLDYLKAVQSGEEHCFIRTPRCSLKGMGSSEVV